MFELPLGHLDSDMQNLAVADGFYDIGMGDVSIYEIFAIQVISTRLPPNSRGDSVVVLAG